jgi:hypothetical protein
MLTHCDYCKYYEILEINYGKCKYNPPQFTESLHYGAFPIIDANDWCGKFKLIGDPKEVQTEKA